MGSGPGKLAEFHAFFGKTGTERLNGLGESYFAGMTDSEKKEAWNFLVNGIASSTEKITGLYHLDSVRAVALFKEAIAHPLDTSPYPAEQKAIDSNRLLMLRYINSVEPDEKYVRAMCGFAKSPFEDVRTEFAQALPAHQLTLEAVDALKGMIFTETDTLALSSAIMKLMLIHGMEFDRRSPLYKSIYLLLRSDDPQEKIKGINRLEQHQLPDYI
jgi:hypothetical protein